MNGKSSNAQSLGQSMTANIDSVSTYMNTIKSAFITERDKAIAAKMQAQQANASSSLATLVKDNVLCFCHLFLLQLYLPTCMCKNLQ